MEKKYGLLGEKLGHSFSPRIHSLLFGYPYELVEVPRDRLAAFFENTDLAGFNVTIPYKKEVISFCREISPQAEAIGSVNTVVRREDGSWYGDNTDYFGFVYMAKQSGVELSDKKALVLGSGGASLTVQTALKDLGAKVTVISRKGPDNYENLTRHEDAAVIVNTTPLGMYPNNGEAAVDLKHFPKAELVLDLIYNPSRTALLLQAERLGIPAFGGLSMLVAQAKKAGEIFTGTAVSDERMETVLKQISSETLNIALIGMPGCGKSTIGQLLAEKTGRPFVDLDEEIQKAAGRPIPEIFAAEGEGSFRKLETRVLQEYSKQSGLIIATGGGIVTTPANHDLLKQNSRIIFLKRDLERLPTEGRPLSQSNRLEDLLAQRLPLYESWSDRAIGNDTDPKETLRQILSVI